MLCLGSNSLKSNLNIIYYLENSSSTYQNVEENTDKIWKSQRCKKIFEFMNLLVVPPPLVFIAYVFKFVKLCKQKYGTTEGETDGIKRF